MKTFVALLVACGTLAAAHSRPLVIQESARISTPDASYPNFPVDVALDVNDALLTLSRFTPSPDGDEYQDVNDTSVWWFRRVNGAWTAVRQIATDRDQYYIWNNGLAMKNGVAALALNPLRIYEKRNNDWVHVYGGTGGGDDPGDSVAIDGNRVIFGGSSGTFKGTLIRKLPTTGAWQYEATLPGEYRSGDDEQFGREVDLSGPYATVISPYSEENPGDHTPSVAIYFDFGGGGSSWGQNAILNNSPETPFGDQVQVRGTEVFVSGNEKTGSFVFQRQSTGQWPLVERLQPLASYIGGGRAEVMRKSDLYVMQLRYDYDRDANVIDVYLKIADGDYDHAATLVSSDGGSLGGFAICGRAVMATCGDQACYFQLPTSLAQPAPLQETFSGTTPTGWTTSAGSSFAIVKSGASRVLRQSETASTAIHTATLTASNWTNQSVQADVKPTAFNGSDRWVGLAARYRDTGNLYYVNLRSSGKVMLRKKVKGVLSTLATAPLPVTLNRTYRLRLEAVGTRIRVYVDGAPLLDVDDTSLASGRAALLSYRTAAEFDNVIVSPTPTATMWVAGLPERTMDRTWTLTGPGQWNNFPGVGAYYAQTSVAGDARAMVGTPTDAQSLDVRARATTFASGGGDPWFGAIVRYTDDYNYYYLTVRRGGTLSLRKRVQGANIVLGTVNMPVTAGQWYQLRLEAVGNQLRAYVGGTLRMEATDSSHAGGMTGIVTYRTAAEFSGYRAIQP